MVRLFIPLSRLAGPRLDLSQDDRVYLFRVRRMRAGDGIEVFDGQGGRYPAWIQTNLETLRLGPRQDDAEPPALQFELWQGLPKGDRMELILQKATELGVTRIVPLFTARSVVQLTGTRATERVKRWRKVVSEAARQCGRDRIPEVTAPVNFTELFQRAEELEKPVGLVYEGESDRSVVDFLRGIPKAGPVALAVGPEGGFSGDEVELALDRQIPLLGLGRKILRTETAAIVVCTLALWAGGGLGGPVSGSSSG